MTRERDLGREPCPDRIIEDLGGAFAMGSLGGFVWHALKGGRNSPRGEILQGALYSAKLRAPLLGGSFAIWGGTFSAFDCSFQYLRKREDHWNSIASGFCTGGVLALRGGWRPATQNAILGGVLLSIIEMVSLIFTRKITPTPRQQFQQQMEYEKSLMQNNPSLASQNTISNSPSSLHLNSTPSSSPSPLPQSTSSASSLYDKFISYLSPQEGSPGQIGATLDSNFQAEQDPYTHAELLNTAQPISSSAKSNYQSSFASEYGNPNGNGNNSAISASSRLLGGWFK